MRRLTPAALLLSTALALAACGTTDPDPPAAPPTSTAPTTDEPTEEDSVGMTPIPVPEDKQPGPGDGALPTGPVPDEVVNRDDVQDAITAEAERRGVDPEQVEVVGYADVTWRDGSLGCPEPGRMYTMALVDGHQLILEVDGKKASYHAAKDKAFAYCANPSSPLPRESS